MRDSEGRKLSIIDGIPHVEAALGKCAPYSPTLADLEDDERGPWLLHHALCQMCGNPRLRRVRQAFARQMAGVLFGHTPRACKETTSTKTRLKL